VNDGTSVSTRLVTTPSAPSATTEPLVSSGPIATRSPSAVTISIPATDVASVPFRLPEPCVPVATAPATVMCGSEARLARANPRASSPRASSAYRMPALTRAVDRAESISIAAGRPSSVISAGESATGLNE